MSIENELASNDYAPGWRPDEQETVIGVLRERATREGKYGAYEIDTIEQDDGTRIAIHRTTKILKEDLARAQIGDRVGIRYLGRSEKGYKRFRVAVEQAEVSQ